MKKSTEKLFLILIPALFTFPLFKENISSFFFILLTVNTLIHTIVTKSYKTFDLKTLWLTIPFFIILIYSLLSDDPAGNLPFLDRGLFFLLFPVIFELIPKHYFTKDKISLYLAILKNGCLLICFAYIAAFFYYHSYTEFLKIDYNISAFRDFVYSEIKFFKIHPTYFSAILILCVALSFERFLKDKKKYELIYIVVFLLLILLLLTKLNIIFITVMIPCMILFRSGFSTKYKVRSILLFVSIAVVSVIFIPGIKNRFWEFYNSYDKPPVDLAYDSTNIRVSILKCSKDIARENYMFGVGFKNLQKELYQCFEENYDSSFYESTNYLTHNYYTYILLCTGIFGLIAFVFYSFKVFRIAYRLNYFLLNIALLNIFVLCFIEDYLYRHYGLFFFSLILMSFMNYSKATYPSQELQSQKSF